jgi:UDP-N-acetyl-D-mannosaminuronate dehydrogenase
LTFPDFVLTAWKLNDSVPAHLVQRLRLGMESQGMSMESTKIAVLGKAFKADIDDDRLSPSLRVIEMLERLGANVVVHDPYLCDVQLDEALRDAHGVVLATNHSMYYKLDLSRLAELAHPECVIVDAWGVFDVDEATRLGLELNTFGRG